MTLKPCPCSGSNENCFRCGGLGTYEPKPKLLKVPSRRKIPTTISQCPVDRQPHGLIKPKSPNEVKCDRCIFKGSPEEVEIHRKKFHRADFVRTRRKPRVPCTKCGQKVRKLARHLNRAHGPVTNAAKETSIKTATFCPKCSCAVSKSNLEKHLRRVHNLQSPIKVILSKTTKQPNRTPARNTNMSASFSYEKEDIREANRMMGFPARENGRFGSHPLHDRFDDESFA